MIRFRSTNGYDANYVRGGPPLLELKKPPVRQPSPERGARPRPNSRNVLELRRRVPGTASKEARQGRKIHPTALPCRAYLSRKRRMPVVSKNKRGGRLRGNDLHERETISQMGRRNQWPSSAGRDEYKMVDKDVLWLQPTGARKGGGRCLTRGLSSIQVESECRRNSVKSSPTSKVAHMEGCVPTKWIRWRGRAPSSQAKRKRIRLEA